MDSETQQDNKIQSRILEEQPAKQPAKETE